MIEKPESVLRQEFIDSLVYLINNSQLSPFVVEPIIRDMLVDVQRLIKRQTENETRTYQEALEKEKEQSLKEETEAQEKPKRGRKK